MKATSPTTVATATGLVSEQAAGYVFNFDGFNVRMAERLHRVEVLTGKKTAPEHEDSALVLAKDEKLRS